MLKLLMSMVFQSKHCFTNNANVNAFYQSGRIVKGKGYTFRGGDSVKLFLFPF